MSATLDAAAVFKGSSTYRVPNLERALVIMEHLLEHPEGLTQAELVDQLGYPKNSVFRISKTLLRHHYLREDPDSRRLTLTHKLLVMGCRNMAEPNLIENSLEVMRALRDAVRETVCLGTVVENEGVVVEQVLGLHPFKFSIDRGMRLDLHVSALGKAILAFLPDTELCARLDVLPLTRYNERTLTSVGALRRELTAVRARGYALDRGEQLGGVHCVGAPVFDHHGYPVAAIWTTGPADRLPAASFDAVGEQVREHARTISLRNGYDLVRSG